ncbi:MAG: hypothetical protein LPJ98_01380 [Cyclobacteriaceae bacterium]|nr:hypothetical protein [Cyclobacteriaceae bacterium]
MEKACKTAMENGVFSYRFIKNIIDNHMEDESLQNNITNLPRHENVRAKSYYSNPQPINFK